MSKPEHRFKAFIDRHAGILLCMPAVALLILFVLYPFVSAIISSFTNQSLKTMLNPGLSKWIGISNYSALFYTPSFFKSLQNTLYFSMIVVPLQTCLALLFAVMVNGSLIWKKILRTSFFLPVITSMAVLAVVWSLLYNPTFGAFNFILSLMGMSPEPFLDSADQAMNCLIVMSVWQGAGFQMMIFLAGMQTIPPQLYEAARVEGASPFRSFFSITLPLLKNTLVFVILITTIFSFKLFIQPHLITQGGPQSSTMTLILELYDQAFVNKNYGRANAISVIFFLIVLAVSLVQKRLLPKEDKS